MELNITRAAFASMLGVVTVFVSAGTSGAHCDGLDGPVVTAARRALEAGEVTPVLIWVQTKDEAEVRDAFQKTLAVRSLGPQAKDLADTYFFETVVRIHRVGEGAPYDGLKPAGRDLGPAIPAADAALEKGVPGPVVALLTDSVRDGVRAHFDVAMKRKTFDAQDVRAGREYVEAYVEYIHFVERLFQATKALAHGHFAEPGIRPAHED
jgi:hypothetical protein